MASTDIWFPMYIGDYMADTLHLSTLEHGAYFLILSAYYKNQGPLPDDDGKMSRIARMTLSDWSAIRSNIASLFKITGGFWVQKRADFEIQKAISTQDARRKGAAITNAKLGRTHSDTLTESPSERSPSRSRVGIPQPQSQSQSEVQSESKSESENKRKGSQKEVLEYCVQIGLPPTDGEWFFDKNEGCGWKNDGKPILDWKATMRSWQRISIFPSQKQTSGHNITPYQQQKALEIMIENHACNAQSKKHTGRETQEQWAEYRKFKANLETVTKIIANGGHQ